MADSLAVPFMDENHDHQTCLENALLAAEKVCRSRRQRFTNIRRKVFELVWQQHKPIGAYQILDMLQQEGRTAPPTVYRALDFLLEVGLVHRIDSLNAFVGCSTPGMPHDGQFLICEVCHSLAELNAVAVTRAVEESAKALDFEVTRSRIEVFGLCPACREKGLR